MNSAALSLPIHTQRPAGGPPGHEPGLLAAFARHLGVASAALPQAATSFVQQVEVLN